MNDRAFPVIYAKHVQASASFYEQLGFEEQFRLPPEGDPGYIGMQRGSYEVAVVSVEWPRDQFGLSIGDLPRFEMFVYVDDVDASVESLRSTDITILREATDMPWGETVAYVTDPDGNPVALAMSTTEKDKPRSPDQ